MARLPGGYRLDLEQLVCQRIAELFSDRQFLCRLTSYAEADVVQKSIAAGDLAAATLRSGSAHDKASLLETIVDRISLDDGGIEISTSPLRIRSALRLTSEEDMPDDPIILSLPATKVRRGHQLRLVIPGPQDPNAMSARRDEKLVSLIAEAYSARQLILAQPDKPIAAIAADVGKCRTRLARIVSLACLAPDIVTAIVQGQQPASLTSRSLLEAELPLAWPDQRRLLGFV